MGSEGKTSGYYSTGAAGYPAWLKGYFLDGVKAPDDLQVGVEWEKIGVNRRTGRAIPYSGPSGVEAIFNELHSRYGWEPERAGGHAIALHKNGSSITLEPGGQIELSGRKARHLDDNALELYRHLSEINVASEARSIVWLGTGTQPISAPDEIEWVPKSRYAIMRAALGANDLTHRMMKQTASVQVSIDYTSEADAARKFTLALALSPVLTALFANSPLLDGRLTGMKSNRAYIWLGTARERTGFPPAAMEPGFGFDSYVEYALDVPLLFIQRGGVWLPGAGRSFREYLEEGLDGHRATPEDWELHLSTIFTDARLKKYIEIRGLDCQRTEMGMAVPALIKGLFYDAKALEETWKLFEGVRAEELERLRQSAPAGSPETRFRGLSFHEIASRLVESADRGLCRLGHCDERALREVRYLKPLERLLNERKTPADLLLERLGGSFDAARNLQDLIEYLSIA